ncbi:MAG TPA: MBL fold metallo-hydrolase [Xanthobacteraceae bacterium]|nr:MBL fold metallo-hydrolase [Xanthobacteraceae bacterium]
MSSEQQLTVRFWGVRGTLPTAGPDTIRYGGNTSCVEVELGRRSVIFDAGTGIRKLGDHLAGHGGSIEADILFSHCHMDHVSGIPFFSPFYQARNRIRLWAGNLLPKGNLEGAIRSIMSPPLFPIEIEAFKAGVEFRDFHAGDMLDLGSGIKARTGMLNHPGGAVGYRLEWAGKSIAYITDTEHRPNELDRTVLSLVQKADLMIYDCTYTDEEFPNHAGWGHSTWQQAVRLADAGGVTRLAIFHHDPDHDDTFMQKVEVAAAKAHPGAFVAREGLVLQL